MSDDAMQVIRTLAGSMRDLQQQAAQQYQPPRTPEEISADILAIEKEAEGLLDGLLGGHKS